MVATNGMLSSTEEITADATSKMIMVNSTSSPVKSISAFASMSMVPVSTMPPTMMNKPQKNVSVVHSTCSNACGTSTREMSMMTAAAVRATTDDSIPSAHGT